MRIRKERVSIGDMVLLYDAALERTRTGKLANRWMGPYRVVEALDWGDYMIAELDGSKWKDPVAAARLKLFRPRPAPTLSLTGPKGKGKAKMEDEAPSRRFEAGESSKKRKTVERRNVKGLALGREKKWLFVLKRVRRRVHIRQTGGTTPFSGQRQKEKRILPRQKSRRKRKVKKHLLCPRTHNKLKHKTIKSRRGRPLRAITLKLIRFV